VKWFHVLIRPMEPAIGPARRVPVWAMSENQAVMAVSRKNLGGVIFAVAPGQSPYV